MEDKRFWLGLAWFEAFGSRTLWKLWNAYKNDPERAWRIELKRLLRLGVREKPAMRFVEWRAKVDPVALWNRCEAETIRFILPDDGEYPPDLAQIADPPFALFCRGGKITTGFAVGVVGTRACTPYGLRAAEELVRPLSEAGAVIVSGLALGIDGAAHRTALHAGGKTIAVLGGGINDASIYPRQHAPLAKDILEKTGVVISEFPPGTESRPYHFPLRNRIIAGISRAILVIEASKKSGSLITATLALSENRDVFAVPGPITSAASSGTNDLIRRGAIACTSGDDILRHFEIVSVRDPPPAHDLTDDERTVLALLDRPLHADEIVRAGRLGSDAVAEILTRLELGGVIMQEEPNVYSKRRFY